MSDKHEATVEVLTAEVRVLQVGRRQVTLSVVRQLDWANPADVVPFGRVRTGNYDDLPGRPRVTGRTPLGQVRRPEPVEIIGSAAGVLVRSVSWRAVLNCTSGEDGCPEARAIIAALRRHGAGTAGHQRALHALQTHYLHDWTHYDPDQRTYDLWEALPLIVLAGLR